MLKLKLQYFGHLMQRTDSLEKTLMLGKIEGRRRRGWQQMRWLHGITGSMDMSLSELRELVIDREAWRTEVHGITKSRTRLSNWTELNWVDLKCVLVSGIQQSDSVIHIHISILFHILFKYRLLVSYFSCSVMSNSFDPMDCTPGLPVHQQLPELNQTNVQWVDDAIQTSHPVVTFSSCLQCFPTSGSFQMSQLFVSGGQSIGVSASTLVLPMNIQDWSPLGWTHWTSLQSKGLSSLLQHHTSKASILQSSAFFTVFTSIHDHWKNRSLD